MTAFKAIEEVLLFSQRWLLDTYLCYIVLNPTARINENSRENFII